MTITIGGGSGIDWPALVAAISAFLALIFAMLQWRQSTISQKRQERRDTLNRELRQPILLLIDRLEELNFDIGGWAASNSVGQQELLRARSTRIFRQLNRTLVLVAETPFGECYDWLSIVSDELVTIWDEIDEEYSALIQKNFGIASMRCIYGLEEGLKKATSELRTDKISLWKS